MKVVGDERRHRPAATVEGVVAAHHYVGPADCGGELEGDVAAVAIGGALDVESSARTARERVAQDPANGPRSGRDRQHLVTAGCTQQECRLEGGLVGGRHAGEAVVVGPATRRELQADRDHVRRKTTPWPPSG
ncbi:MAG: hypothetical protein FD127_178 [Acidimicrobiaceae bacterium]|nr:MAG: hypothetical protein FD127_178 [Acidimicrobiaceae bacterium]